MLKKLVSGILTGAMVLSMSVSAFAAGTAASDVAGLSTYNTEYTTYVKLGGDRKEIDLAVTGMTSGYERTPLSEDQADAVDWTVTTAIGGLDDTKIAIDTSDKEDDGYVSIANVDVSAVEDYGYAVVQAELPGIDYPTLDFTIVFNPAEGATIKSVEGITCKFTKGTEVLANVEVGEVGKSDIADSSEYPNALYATKLAEGKGGVSEIKGIENGYIQSITIGEDTYDSDGGYWTYRLLDANGEEIPASANVGANVIPLQNNYTVVWNYTAY